MSRCDPKPLQTPLEQCVALFRGPAGSKLRLQVVDLTNGQTNTVTCKRARLPVRINGGPDQRLP